MVVNRWDPFRELRPLREIRRVEDTVDRVWRGLGAHAVGTAPDDASWAIPLDVVRDGDNVVAHASLPGVKPEDISVTIDDSVLTISGHTETEADGTQGKYLVRERRTGTFQRSLRLSDSIDAENAESSYEAGVLTITLPKLEAKKAKQLSITVKGVEEQTAK